MIMKSGIACLLIAAMNTLTQAQEVDLEACLARVITNKHYQAPSPAEFTQATDLFQRTLEDRWADGKLTTSWAALGFEFRQVTAMNEQLWLLSESAGNEAGRGWFLFRTDSRSSLALQAPHARNDVHTGVIALRLFLAGRARVLAASTITRHRADMAHLDDTFFQAFTLAFARACPTGMVVQLHGFDAPNRPELEAEIIASAGTRSPEPWLADVVQRLNKLTALPALAYPQDTRQLGGTLNAQSRALRQSRDCRFLHLEMSRELRERLTNDAALRRTILDCVTAAVPR